MSAVHARAAQADEKRPAPTWALILLPIVAVVLVYVWWPRARIEQVITYQSAELASARASAPSIATETSETNAVLDLRERAAELRAKAEKSSPSARIETGPVAHARRAASVTSALARHGLALVEDLTAQDVGEDAARRLQGLHASEIRATGAPARSVRFEGGYFAALAALREISGSTIEALPLLVEFERSADGRTLRWRLVWI